jgi:hypothetical protein
LFDGEASGAIHQGNTSNLLWAECTDDDLILTVNGIKISEVSDDTFPSGDIGIVVGTHAIPGVKILLDEFTAFEP